jgi:hypothetical protein
VACFACRIEIVLSAEEPLVNCPILFATLFVVLDSAVPQGFIYLLRKDLIWLLLS